MYRRQITITRARTVIVLVALLLPAGLTSHARADTGTSGWRQSNVSGFGIPQNTAISSLATFDGHLYAGTWNDNGAHVWRTAGGQAWSQFSPPWVKTNVAVNDMAPFDGHLYVCTGNESGGEIWRTNGTAWERIGAGGFDDTGNYNLAALAVFDNRLYIATGNLTTGVEIWRSSTGNSGSWSQVNHDGFGHGVTWENATLDTFNDQLYAGVSRVVGGVQGRAELWRSANGVSWDPVFTNGLGNAASTDVSAMAEFGGYFYIGLRNETTGGQVWRSTNGTDFSPVFTNGLGKAANSRPYGLLVDAGQLYLVFSNIATGAEVWQTPDGATWRPVMQGGWGKGARNGFADYFDKAATVFRDALYVGTVNDQDGGEIWQMLRQVYLPFVQRR